MTARFKGPIELILKPVIPQGRDTEAEYLLVCKETNDWGVGTTVQRAYDDLMLVMEGIYRIYVLDNRDKLSEGAMELRQWLIDNVDVEQESG